MNKKQHNIKYNIYATLLNSFTSYENADDIYEKYWGWSEHPQYTLEEFRAKQFQDFIDRINRKPFTNLAVTRGSAFNDLIDWICSGEKPELTTIDVCDYEKKNRGKVVGTYPCYKCSRGEDTFYFCKSSVDKLADKYNDSDSQVYCEGVIETNYGDVKLYGYIDYLHPMSVADLKTTGNRYQPGSYADGSQHLVYLFNLRQDGNDIDRFDYDIVSFVNDYDFDVFQESYYYDDERDSDILRRRVERLIDFIEEHKNLITNKKLFNE